MANYRWIGNGLAVAQVTEWTFGGTWEADDIVDITINGKTISVTTGSTVISTLLDTIAAALNLSTIAEFAEITWSKGGTTKLVATADNAGVPFSVLLSTRDIGGAADAQTIDSGTINKPGTVTTACKGPSVVDDPENYLNTAAGTTGTLPGNGDSLVLENCNVPLLYHLDALAGVTLASLTHFMSHTAAVGLPKTNASGYREYRPDYFQIGATTATLGLGAQGTGSGRIKLDFGSAQTTTEVLNTGQSLEFPLEAVLLKGTHASNSFTFKGEQTTAALAAFGGESATVATLHVNNATVRCEAGVTFPGGGSIENYGGNLSIRSAIGGTAYNVDGNLLIRGAGTIATLDITGGDVDEQGTGDVTNLLVGPGRLTRENDSRALNVTNATMRPGGEIYDPTQAINYINNVARAGTVQRLVAA